MKKIKINAKSCVDNKVYTNEIVLGTAEEIRRLYRQLSHSAVYYTSSHCGMPKLLDSRMYGILFDDEIMVYSIVSSDTILGLCFMSDWCKLAD